MGWLQGVLDALCFATEMGAYLKYQERPKFDEPDSTSYVMTWDELLEHTNLVAWDQNTIKGDAQLQNKFVGICKDMCKDMGAYLKYQERPKFDEPDSTSYVMT